MISAVAHYKKVHFTAYQDSTPKDPVDTLLSHIKVSKNIYECLINEKAVSILTLIDQVFGDILRPIVGNSTECCEDADIEDELDFALRDWNDLIEDDDFMDLIIDHLDSSQMPSELQEKSNTSSHLLDNDIPSAVLEIQENCSFEDV